MTPDKVQARKMVLVSSLLLLAISIYRNRKNETAAGTYRRVWATGVVSLVLSLLADFVPTVAGPFAVLTVLGWIVTDGTSLLDQVLPAVTSGGVPSSSTRKVAPGVSSSHTASSTSGGTRS